MGMLEDDLEQPPYPCAKCGSRKHWERDCMMTRSDDRAKELADPRPLREQDRSRAAFNAHCAAEDKRSKQPTLGAHMATLNLFREADGTYHITVAEARGFIDGWKGEPMKAAPIYYVERAIVEAADTMRKRLDSKT